MKIASSIFLTCIAFSACRSTNSSSGASVTRSSDIPGTVASPTSGADASNFYNENFPAKGSRAWTLFQSAAVGVGDWVRDTQITDNTDADSLSASVADDLTTKVNANDSAINSSFSTTCKPDANRRTSIDCGSELFNDTLVEAYHVTSYTLHQLASLAGAMNEANKSNPSFESTLATASVTNSTMSDLHLQSTVELSLTNQTTLKFLCFTPYKVGMAKDASTEYHLVCNPR